jgi:hypothetical protein
MTYQLHPILQCMVENPKSRNHLLFLGPPGSGKTTAAQEFSTCLHGKQTNKFASVLFLNSSDERSLETIRQKIYPFVESRMQNLFFTQTKMPPKILIFDEAETLTDQAQCALRPLLQRSTEDIIVIFICNSLSHIHHQILNKFLIIPFTPTQSEKLNRILESSIPKLDSILRRGDIRFFKQCPHQESSITNFLSNVLHARTKDQLWSVFSKEGAPIRDRVSWFLLFFHGSNLTLQDISYWSALTSSETYPYLEQETFKDLLWKLWCAHMINTTPMPWTISTP